MIGSIVAVVLILVVAAWIKHVSRKVAPYNHRGDGTDKFTQRGRVQS